MNNDDTLQVRDKRANNRYFVDNALLRGGWGNKLGPHAIAVYNAIALHADIDTQSAYPSRQKIADLTGMSSRQVSRELEKLAAYKIIHIESRAIQRKSSLIFLLDVDEWTPPHQTEGHMPESHISSSQPTTDSQSDEHMTGSHTNKTHENKTQRTKPKGGAAEKTPLAPSLREQAQKGEMTTETEINLLAGYGRQGKAGVADPTQDEKRWLVYKDKAVNIVKEITGTYPNKSQQTFISQMVTDSDFDFERWEKGIHSCQLHNVRPGNVGCYIATYKIGGDYQILQANRKSKDSERPSPKTPDWAQEDWEPIEDPDFITS